jgi:hypothetical protein
MALSPDVPPRVFRRTRVTVALKPEAIVAFVCAALALSGGDGGGIGGRQKLEQVRKTRVGELICARFVVASSQIRLA